MICVEAPNRHSLEAQPPFLFLAGGITGCPDWQREMVAALADMDGTIFNPRRVGFDINDPTASQSQIGWEWRALRHADIISFWFCKETVQPIALFELGSVLERANHSQYPLGIAIGVEPGYAREPDIRIQTRLERPDIEVVSDMADLAKQVRKMLEEACP